MHNGFVRLPRSKLNPSITQLRFYANLTSRLWYEGFFICRNKNLSYDADDLLLKADVDPRKSAGAPAIIYFGGE